MASGSELEYLYTGSESELCSSPSRTICGYSQEHVNVKATGVVRVAARVGLGGRCGGIPLLAMKAWNSLINLGRWSFTVLSYH